MAATGFQQDSRMRRSFVVTGGGRGVGRALVERLLGGGEDSVVAVELDPAALAWTGGHPALTRPPGGGQGPGPARMSEARSGQSQAVKLGKK
jgi:NAD(P)-dependent dehydrogenase (short-subunit alcohol dehydrogenase family)